ncbi:hypothetical protein LWI28_001848 [Acer negundo]|uniref:RNase H type-1 domain-containing protein n=1 Tax=Acer negundo TaxID=4023 RepID=A0AAD5I5B2_ACENE|nr:hypothetical protein LWI28_001848 [Acer negundo]
MDGWKTRLMDKAMEGWVNCKVKVSKGFALSSYLRETKSRFRRFSESYWDGRGVEGLDGESALPFLPAERVLIFNLDGSDLGSPSPTGMGGVLRDSMGKVLCLFYLFFGIKDSISAKILDIHKACDVVQSNRS